MAREGQFVYHVLGKQLVDYILLPFNVLVWPKSSFRFFCKMLQKNPDDLFGQSNIMLKKHSEC